MYFSCSIYVAALYTRQKNVTWFICTINGAMENNIANTTAVVYRYSFCLT